jgi:hypothetical protein
MATGWDQRADIDDRYREPRISDRDSMGLAGVAFMLAGLIGLAGAVWIEVDVRWFGGTVTAFVWALVLFVVYRQTRR